MRAGCRSATSRSGTSGRRPTATSGRCTACSGARGRRPTAATSTRSRASSSSSRHEPELAPHHRQRLERRGAARDGAAALPRLLPVLRRPGHRARRAAQAQLPALPAQRRHLPRRAVQHRQLRPAHPHAGAAVRPRRRRLHLDRRRLPHLQQPRRAGRAAALARAAPLSDAARSRAARRRSSTTRSRTSRSSATTRIRRSRPRSRSRRPRRRPRPAAASVAQFTSGGQEAFPRAAGQR